MKIKTLGFTLIELLVVIGIISLLSTIIISGLNISRKKAQTAAAFQDLKEIQKALELYYDKYGFYPVTTTSPSEWGGYWDQSTVASFIPELASEGFLKTVPKGRGDIFYNYSRIETSGNPGFCLVDRTKYDYALVAYNLEPVKNITNGDDCEKSTVWKTICDTEANDPKIYCLIKPK